MGSEMCIRDRNLAYHIRLLDDNSLAKQVMDEQVQKDWPGLAREVMTLCEELDIENIMEEDIGVSKNSWKNTVKKAIFSRNEKELKEKIQDYSKLEELKSETTCERQEYLSTMSMAEARIKFRLRTFTFPCKMNQSSDPRFRAELWRCDSCFSLLDPGSRNNINSQSHILWCPAYHLSLIHI